MSTDAATRAARTKDAKAHEPMPPSAPAPASSSQFRKETVAIRDGLKVVRLVVQPGGRIPEHHSSVVVVVTVVRGSGVFTVAGRPRPVQAGDVIDMAPGVHHSVLAEDELELVVVHARVGLPPSAAT